MVNRIESPIERFDHILHWQCVILKMIGMNGFRNRFRLNPLFIVMMFLAGLFMVASFYDLFVMFPDDLYAKAFVLATIFFGFIGWGRIHGVVAYRDYFPRMTRMTRESYLRGMQDERHSAILHFYTDILSRVISFYAIVYLVGVMIAAIGPILLHLYNGEKILPFGVYLPFLDPNTSVGYELNYLHQLSCMIWTPPGLTATQNIYFSYILHICIQYDVLEVDLADLDEIVQRQFDPKERDTLVREKLRYIIVSHTRLEEFVKLIEHVYSTQAIVEVMSLTLQLVLTLYVMRMKIWLPGLILIPLCIMQLLILCIPGTLIEIKSTQLIETIYGISWHEMSQQNKRIFQLLLQRSQHPSVLTCGGMVVIDMNLFVNVSKKVYSIFMMMENMM